MQLTIHDSYKLSEIREEFSRHFPYLKLEFFSFAAGEKKIFSEKNLVTDGTKLLGDVRHFHNFGHLSINGHQKVGTLEQNFLKTFGIDVQVFRKSGKVWLQTTDTDNWTLAEQNKKGEEMENESLEAAMDYDQYYEQSN